MSHFFGEILSPGTQVSTDIEVSTDIDILVFDNLISDVASCD